MNTLLDEEKIKKLEVFYDKIHHVEMEYLKYWIDNTLWHWEFWLSVSLTIIPWILWFIFRKRGSEARLFLAGSFVLIISSYFDFIGIVCGFWHYAGKVLPTIPTYIPWDVCLMPVSIMLWLQFKPKSNPFLKSVIYSLVVSFIGEPLFEWIGLYSSDKWNSFYSFPIHAVIYLAAYRISNSKTFNTL